MSRSKYLYFAASKGKLVKMYTLYLFLSTYCTRSDDSGTVGPDQPGFTLSRESVLHADHILLGDSLGDANDQRDLGFDGLENGRSGARRRDVNHGSVGVHLIFGLC